eukprot:scaffold14211_cov33-Tisochrysis_lutea.AAC.1
MYSRSERESWRCLSRGRSRDAKVVVVGLRRREGRGRIDPGRTIHSFDAQSKVSLPLRCSAEESERVRFKEAVEASSAPFHIPLLVSSAVVIPVLPTTSLVRTKISQARPYNNK